jgi:hypothetical protein
VIFLSFYCLQEAKRAVAEEKIQEEQAEKEEEERVKQFQAKWDALREERCKKRVEHFQTLLNTPTHWVTNRPENLSPEETAEWDKLMARIKKQMKVVLRRADDAKIPMEYDEAEGIAIEELMAAEVEDEKEKVKVSSAMNVCYVTY